MLIPSEKEPASVPLSSPAAAEPNAVEPSGGPFDDQDDLTLQENPPAYSPSSLPAADAEPFSGPGPTNMTDAVTAAGTTGAPAPPFPAERSAANFVTIKCKDRTIRDAFVIDPTLPRPHDDLVSPSPGGENADKNLYVMCKDGTIAADVWLVGRSKDDQQLELQLQEQPKEEREKQGSVRQNHAALDFQGKDADITVNLRTLSDCTYDLNVKAKDCKVSVAIPPSFVGPVILEVHDSSLKLSDRMKERLTTFSDINKKRSCFMGDFNTLGYTTKDEWKGSSIKIYIKDTRIRLSFVDEQPPELPKGFFAKLLHGKEKD